MASPLAFDPAIARDLFANLNQIHLVYIHPNGIGVHGREFATDIDAALSDAARMNADGFNVYWTVNIVKPGLNKKPTKADITHARFVHVDIDPPKSGGAFDKGEIVASLLDIAAPPSFVIDSGGGLQAFWRLDDPCAHLVSIEGINTQARDWFEADAWQNIDRLMRVPGSVNWPDKKKQLRGRVARLATFAAPDEGLVYAPEELAATFPPVKAAIPGAAPAINVALPANVELVDCDGLGLSALDPLRLAINEPPGHDRSGDGLAAARLMANAGFADERIMGVLLNPANPVSAHYLAQRDPRRAVARSIQVVRSDGPPSGEALHAPIMPDEDFAAFVANCKAKVREAISINDDQDEVEAEAYGGAGSLNSFAEPQWLTMLGDGGIAQFVRHVIRTAPRPQPYVTLGAAISMFGAIAGRRYASPTDFRTNIYAIGICDSAGGKDRPLRSITRLMTSSGLSQKVAGSKIASGQAMITDITRSPNIIYPIDEVGFMLSSVTDRKRAPKHLTDIIGNFTEFYSNTNETFLGTSYADQSEQNGKPRQVIEQPCLCLFGVTTPGIFWDSISSDNVKDGSLARFIIFPSDMNYPDRNHNAGREPFPDELIELVKAIDRGPDGHTVFPIGEGSAQVPKPYVVPYADDGVKMFWREMSDQETEMLRMHEGTNLTGIIGRLVENATKIALIKAITDNPNDPRITIPDLEWGMLIAKKSVNTIKQAVKERVADNAYEADMKAVHGAIANAGSAGIDRTALARAVRIDARRRKDILAHLEEAGMIRVAKFKRSDGAAGNDRVVFFDIA